jgi:hypothetical protein
MKPIHDNLQPSLVQDTNDFLFLWTYTTYVSLMTGTRSGPCAGEHVTHSSSMELSDITLLAYEQEYTFQQFLKLNHLCLYETTL